MNNHLDVLKSLKEISNHEKSLSLQRFFKTGKGEYAEGDKFLGVVVPEQRSISKKFKDLSFPEIEKLLKSEFHECRLTALLILLQKPLDKKVFDFYLKNIDFVNNWDLVDASAPKIVGAYLFSHPRTLLYKLAKSKNLWQKRISIVSTFYFISKNDFSDTLKISEILLSDQHDLIHKAVGWMLREVGKRDPKTMTDFLDKNIKKMPRTALRYAIERLSEKKRKYYLGK